MNPAPSPAGTRCILCTTGTSIAQGCPALVPYLKGANAWDHTADDLVADISRRVLAANLEDPAAQRRLSAEINSLSRLGVRAGDEIVLLATDTAEGRVCAEALQTVAMMAFQLDEAAVRLVRVPGLQVRNADDLRTRGLPSLLRALLAEVQRAHARPGCEVVLNPTGGYKGVVPFVAIIGMLYSLKTIYIFEHAESLIELPPLPLTFDLRLFLRAKPALEKVLVSGGLERGHYLGSVSGFQEHEESLFLSFVEQGADGLCHVSPLATILLEADKQGPDRVKLGPEVAAVRSGLTGLQRARFELLIARVAQPLWRSQHRHAFAGTDLEVYKPGNVPERIAGITAADAFCVCEYFADHADYERRLPGCRRADYKLAKFTALAPAAPLAALEAGVLSEAEVLSEQLLKREQEIEDLVRQGVERELAIIERRKRKRDAQAGKGAEAESA